MKNPNRNDIRNYFQYSFTVYKFSGRKTSCPLRLPPNCKSEGKACLHYLGRWRATGRRWSQCTPRGLWRGLRGRVWPAGSSTRSSGAYSRGSKKSRGRASLPGCPAPADTGLMPSCGKRPAPESQGTHLGRQHWAQLSTVFTSGSESTFPEALLP